MRKALCLVLAPLLLVGCLVAPAPDPGETHDGVIYLETFSGAPTEFLHGKQPDQGRATWLSIITHTVPSWRADGTLASPPSRQNRNAFLPFVPKDGRIYTLSLEVNPTSGDAAAEFFALGFAKDPSPEQIFASRDVIMAGPWWAQAWNREHVAVSYVGPGDQGGANTPSKEGWVELKIVLNTTEEQWIAEWFYDGEKVRTHQYATNPTINYVGFGAMRFAAGAVRNFQLVGEIPAKDK
ncbi:MAG TPA: hypothetical protein GXX57_06440 [Firmicutes bacterium]|nr:hypothetical protein [Bacillota bacterium]